MGSSMTVINERQQDLFATSLEKMTFYQHLSNTNAVKAFVPSLK